MEAQSIFKAKVTRVDAVYPSQIAATVEPDRYYKGKPPTFVVTNDDGDQCGAGLEVGQSYLFYSRGVKLPYVSVFDTHRLGVGRTERLLDWLEERTKKREPRPPRTETVLGYGRGQIRVFYENHDLGQPADAFIANHSVYVTPAFFGETLWFAADWNPAEQTVAVRRTNRSEFEVADPADRLQPSEMAAPERMDAEYRDIRIVVESNSGDPVSLRDHPPSFIAGGDVYVPLRAVAEQLGFEVEWIGSSTSVVLHRPVEEQTGPRLLSMKYVGPGRTLEIERLTGHEIEYRVSAGGNSEETEARRETVPFADMLAETDGRRTYTIQFFLKMDQGDLRLLPTHELVRKLESDASFRELVGRKLGKPFPAIPANRVLRVDDFFN